MRRLDDLAPGTYELELLREVRTPDPRSPRGPRGTSPNTGVLRRILRVVSTSEEVEDTRWESRASPSARFVARVEGPCAVTLARR